MGDAPVVAPARCVPHATANYSPLRPVRGSYRPKRSTMGIVQAFVVATHSRSSRKWDGCLDGEALLTFLDARPYGLGTGRQPPLLPSCLAAALHRVMYCAHGVFACSLEMFRILHGRRSSQTRVKRNGLAFLKGKHKSMGSLCASADL